MNNKLKIAIASVLGLIGGFLGTLSGQGYSKLFRRLGIPAILALTAFITLKNPLALILLAIFGILTLGYGIPDANDNKPSFLGSIALKLAKGNTCLANVFVRGFIGLLEAIVMIVVPIIKHNWGVYILVAPVIVLDNIVVSVLLSNVKEVEIGKFKLLPSEVVLYTTFVFAGVLLILL